MPKVEHSFVRPWGGSADDLLVRLRSALEHTGFRLTAPAPWSLQGEAGSYVGMSQRNLPVGVGAAVTKAADGTVAAEVNLADRMPVPFAGPMVERTFGERFVEIERAVDVALGIATPVAQAPSPSPVPAAPSAGSEVVPTPTEVGQPDPAADREGIVERAGTAWDRLSAKTQETAASMLGRDVEPWQKIGSVTFWCPPEHATVAAARIQEYAAVVAMVQSQPGSLPDNLTDDLLRFARELRDVLNRAGAADMSSVRHDIESSQRPIVEFLEQQARMRDELPVRTLHHCRDCGQDKVSNPDYQKLKDRNRKMSALTGAVGLSLRGGAVSPFLLVGALFRLKKLDPDYVCPRCQGMDADESIATFCPQCGALRSEAVLRRCSECDHDFRSSVGLLELWQAHAVQSPDSR